MIVALLGCAGWIDLDDCRMVGGACEVFRPEGFLCGLEHAGWTPAPGAACTTPEGTWNPTVDGACPDGFVRIDGVTDDESGAQMTGCRALGNATSSSGDLAEVPRGSACGFNTVGERWPTENTCMGAHPYLGECPEGFALRFGLDRTFNCEEDDTTEACTDGTLTPRGHLLVWCELVDGCVGDACPDGPDPVCGLQADPYHDVATYRDVFWPDEVPEELAAVLDAVIADVEPARCGEVTTADQCPEGTTRACLPDRTGSSSPELAWPDSLCWCTRAPL